MTKHNEAMLRIYVNKKNLSLVIRTDMSVQLILVHFNCSCRALGSYESRLNGGISKGNSIKHGSIILIV